MTQYNSGNVPYELHIRKNTVLSNLGKYELENIQNNTAAKPVELCDVLNTSGERICMFYNIIVYIIIF